MDGNHFLDHRLLLDDDDGLALFAVRNRFGSRSRYGRLFVLNESGLGLLVFQFVRHNLLFFLGFLFLNLKTQADFAVGTLGHVDLDGVPTFGAFELFLVFYRIFV